MPINTASEQAVQHEVLHPGMTPPPDKCDLGRHEPTADSGIIPGGSLREISGAPTVFEIHTEDKVTDLACLLRLIASCELITLAEMFVSSKIG